MRDLWRLIVLLTMPTAVVLSTWIGVGGCGCPNLWSVIRNTLVSCVEKKGDKFGLCRGSCYQFDDSIFNVNVSFEFYCLSFHGETAKEEITAVPTTPPTCRTVQCVGVNVEYHVGCAEAYDGFGVPGHVVK